MKRILPLLILLLFSGCTRLSETQYLTVEGAKLERKRNACGYADVEWALFGRGNCAEYADSEVGASIEFCSTPYYSKDIATGPIIPIIPLFADKSDGLDKQRWLRIKNTSKGKNLTFVGVSNSDGKANEIEVCTSKYPGIAGDCKTEDTNISEITIKEGSHLWIAIPALNRPSLRLRLDTQLLNISIIESKGYSWWLVTV